MTRSLPNPPPVLQSARVLEYALLDESVRYSGHSFLFVDGKELGPVPCLAICQALGHAGVLLFHCSRDWSILGAAEYASPTEARNRAERIYPGLSTHWIETHVNEQETARYLEEVVGDQRCSFCGKRPDEIERLISKNDARICDSCIMEFHEMLREDSHVKE